MCAHSNAADEEGTGSKVGQAPGSSSAFSPSYAFRAAAAGARSPRELGEDETTARKSRVRCVFTLGVREGLGAGCFRCRSERRVSGPPPPPAGWSLSQHCHQAGVLTWGGGPHWSGWIPSSLGPCIVTGCPLPCREPARLSMVPQAEPGGPAPVWVCAVCRAVWPRRPLPHLAGQVALFWALPSLLALCCHRSPVTSPVLSSTTAAPDVSRNLRVLSMPLGLQEPHLLWEAPLDLFHTVCTCGGHNAVPWRPVVRRPPCHSSLSSCHLLVPR